MKMFSVNTIFDIAVKNQKYPEFAKEEINHILEQIYEEGIERGRELEIYKQRYDN